MFKTLPRPKPAPLAIALALAALAGAAQATTCVDADHCPIKVVNDSKVFANSQIWILASAQDDSYVWPNGTACQGQTAAALICPTGYIQFDANGIGSFVQPAAGQTSLPYAVSIDKLPADSTDASGNTRVLQMPRHGSGRIFVTIGSSSVTTSVIGTASPFSISSPSIASNLDPNFYTLYDKFETSYLHNTPSLTVNPLYIDLTSVDFVSLPLSLSLEGASPANAGPVGYLGSRANLFSTLQSGLADKTTQNWQALLQSDGSTPLRVIAPNDATQSPYAFDAGYYAPYIGSVWTSYAQAGNSLTIDASEVLPSGTTLCTSSSATNCTQHLTYTGTVMSVASAADCGVDSATTDASCSAAYNGYPAGAPIQVMCFKQDVNPVAGQTAPSGYPATIPILMPSSFDMIGGAGTLCAPDKTPRAVIAKDMSAALNRGLLPLTGNTLINDSDTSASGFWSSHAADYYTNWPAGSLPNYNLYAQVLHTLSTGGIYAFAFDDVGGQSSTLVDNNSTAAVVTINDMTGTALPNPKAADSHTYDVTFGIPACQAISLDGQAVASGAYMQNLASPLKLVWNGQALDYYPGTNYFDPPAIGAMSYNIGVFPGQGANGSLQLSFPSPEPSPWPGGTTTPAGSPQVSLMASLPNAQQPISLQFALYANGSAGKNADWYLVINTSDNQWHWYDATANSWTTSPITAPVAGYTGPLIDTGCVSATAPSLPAGTTTIYFGADTTTANGQLDPSTLVYTSATLSLPAAQ